MQTQDLQTRNNGEIEVKIPYYLDWEFLKYKCCFCRKKDSEVNNYFDILEEGYNLTMENMDIIGIIRR